MARLTKRQQYGHQEAVRLSTTDRSLSLTEVDYILDNYREDAQHLNGVAGAFFTPEGLANDFALHVPDGARVLDLCAGIGRLTHAIGLWDERTQHGAVGAVCVELNPDYAEVGKKVVPWATWVVADAFDTEAYAHLGPFDCVIANPPFGRIKVDRSVPDARYTGPLFELRLLELAVRLAPRAVFLLPQESAPFRLSGRSYYECTPHSVGGRFVERTGIQLRAGLGVDTAVFREEWHGPSVVCEIVVHDPAEN